MSEERDERGELVPIGGLWANEDREGRTFLSGYLGDARLLVFKNKFKKQGDKQPDYRAYVARKPKPDRTDALADSDSDPLAADAGEGAALTVTNGKGDAPPF